MRAKAKAMPTWATHAATWGPSSSTAMPNSSSTSDDPLVELALRLPCLHTLAPAPAATKLAAVDTLSARVRAAGRATGADDVDHVVLGQLERRCGVQHGVDHARHLGRRLALAPQTEQKPRQLGVGGLAGQHDGHRVAALVGGQVGAVDQPTQQGRPATVDKEVAHSSILGGTSWSPVIGIHRGQLAVAGRSSIR
jgi:hypothetical protein